MTAWGLCATVRAPADQVLAFVAHHLALGATRIWLHFDDPDDPARAAVAHLPQVTAIACGAAYWAGLIGRRPDRHQNRQARNMLRVYRQAALPWLAHIDVDEFLWPVRPVDRVLADLPADRVQLRLSPWEALHDPALPDDIFTARHFRAALRGPARAAERAALFGPYAPLLPQGVLSHSAGKCFFRTGIPGLEPRLHGAFLNGARLADDRFAPDIALLHFHAQDAADWLARLPFRLTRGAYQFNPALQAHLAACTPDGIAAFYRAVQLASPETLARLRAMGALIEADLHLRDRIRALPPSS